MVYYRGPNMTISVPSRADDHENLGMYFTHIDVVTVLNTIQISISPSVTRTFSELKLWLMHFSIAKQYLCFTGVDLII
jgi:hypothetical protein